MSFLTKFGLTRSRFTALLMLALVASGFLLYVDFSKREAPEITIRTAIVEALYPGMPPIRVENLVAERVERKIREIAEVDEIRTVLTTGRMRTYVDLKDEVTNLEPIWQSLRDKMEEVSRDLPEGAYGPFVNTEFGEVSIASIAMTAEGFSYREMEEAARTCSGGSTRLTASPRRNFTASRKSVSGWRWTAGACAPSAARSTC